ncbi:MAG: hypothetical protein ACO3F2_04690 [Roseiflexaceae bacterium]|jgi:hypothetical protein
MIHIDRLERYWLIAVGIVFGGFAAALLAFAYFQDIAAVAATPSLIWQFVCGIPVDDGITGPLMVTFGTITTTIGIGAWFWPNKQ